MELTRGTPSRELPFDQSFKLTGTHRFIFNFADKNGGIFNRDDYLSHLQNSGVDPKMQKQMMGWNLSTLKKLEAAGYIESVGTGKYRPVDVAVAWMERPKPKADFKLGSNHLKLLEKHNNGIVKSIELKREHKGKPTYEYDRQSKMIDGMIKSLINNGYLSREEKGVYRLTDDAFGALIQSQVEGAISINKEKEQSKSKVNDFKITAFDRHVLAVADEQGNLRSDYIEVHERCESIKKRIHTLTKVGLIKDGKITAEVVKRILTAEKLKDSKVLTKDLLSKQQLNLLNDIRIFSNLSPSQIAKHIYKDDSASFSADVSMLLRHNILEKNETYGIYVIGKDGTSLLRQINPELPIFKSKVYKKEIEVGHDVLVYSAFKDVENQIKNDGGKIILIQNDRMMRSEDMKLYGSMKGKGEYPDIRVVYADKYGTERTHNIEMDCGYDNKTINVKLSAFFNSSGTGSFTWCCNTIRQASKVAQIAGNDKSKKLNKHKPLHITYIDESGNIRKMKWS
jgi:hypothetical protein